MSNNEKLLVKTLSKNAVIPKRADIKAAGFDLYAADNYVIPPYSIVENSPQNRVLIKTDIAISLPSDTYGRIAPRSGLALNHGIDVLAGVVDFSFRGNIGVILINLGQTEFVVKQGDRIAQLILEKISYAEIEQVDDLDVTERGSRGFGSSGN